MGLQRLLPCEVAMGLREGMERGRAGEPAFTMRQWRSGGTGLDGREREGARGLV